MERPQAVSKKKSQVSSIVRSKLIETYINKLQIHHFPLQLCNCFQWLESWLFVHVIFVCLDCILITYTFEICV